ILGLGAMDFVFGALAFGDVVTDAQHGRCTLEPDDAAGEITPALLAALGADAGLIAGNGSLARLALAHKFRHSRTMLRMDDIHHRHAHEFVAREAGEALRSGIHIDEAKIAKSVEDVNG